MFSHLLEALDILLSERQYRQIHVEEVNLPSSCHCSVRFEGGCVPDALGPRLCELPP